MADPFRAPGMILPPSMQAPGFRPKPLTDYERELQPIYQQEMQKEETERNWMRPLQWVLDRLQTGQYISANVADVIIKTAQGVPQEDRQNLFQAVTSGITGEKKGTYENVIRDTLEMGRSKIFGGAPEGTRRSQVDWADVLGFVGDIILDPLTYMSFGGAAKGATKAAGEFADDTVRLYLRELAKDPDTLRLVTRGNLIPQQIEGALSEGTEKALNKLTQQGGDLSKVMQDVYQSAYREGLRKTQKDLVEMTTGKIREIGEPEGGLAQWGLGDLAARLEKGNIYQGSGTTFGARFMTKELGVGPERGLTRVRRETWDKFSNFFKHSKVGSKVSDGVWGVMNTGVVGEIRRALGFRNPYQKYLRAKELNAMKVGEVAQIEAAQDVLQPIIDFSDDELAALYKQMGKQEDISFNVAGEFEKPSERVLGIVKSGDPKIDQAAEKLDGVLRRIKANEDYWSQRLGEEVADTRSYYLTKLERYRKSGMNVRAPRKYTYSQSIEREIELTKFIYGVDDDLARDLVQANVTGVGTDIREALIERAMIHGRAKGRWAMFEQIREMGIDIGDTMDPAANALRTSGREIKELGLETIDHTAFKDMAGKNRFLFDREVSKIFQNAVDMSGKGKNIFTKLMSQYATWWKGVVLATSGYHARNFMTNTMIQFLHHGPRAFRKDEIMKSAAAVWYVLKKSDPRVNLTQYLDEVGLGEQGLSKYLNMPVGNMSVRELADEAWHRNVISQSTMGYDRRSVLDQFQGKTKQPIRSASRAVGNYVENIPRFQSFMIDYMDNATADITKLTKETLLDVEKPALDFAAAEAKKYFLDYEDLTDFERGFLKNVIPFYTFLRKNLASQLSALTIYPEMYSLIPKIEDFITYDDPDYDPSMVPEWMRNEGMFPIRRADAGLGVVGRALESVGVDMGETEGFRFFRPDFAYNDLNLIPLRWEEGDWLPHFDGEELKDTLINATAPWIRRTVDFMMDSENAYQFFYQSDMQPTSDAPYLMRLFASRPEVVPFVDGLLKIAGYKNGAHLDVEDNKLKIDSRMALVLEEYLPVIRQASYLFYLVDDLPWVEDILQNHMNVEDEYEGAEKVMQNLSYWLGVKMRDEDLEREKERLARDIYYGARDILSEQRRQAPGAEQRSLDYRQRTQESIRRLR